MSISTDDEDTDTDVASAIAAVAAYKAKQDEHRKAANEEGHGKDAKPEQTNDAK